jgi:hypothetical protein
MIHQAEHVLCKVRAEAKDTVQHGAYNATLCYFSVRYELMLKEMSASSM